ncbi:hypothetical protein CO674_10820 [Rhizobium hidalgonense]|uniref:Uncharacterized protein n=1 Tax=Rhizobium hidalgonense TaxID=1538159 RepID=A0ABX4JVG9_9HYPH|nr:hypothetical protein CO674_10820 [Rhizobium hidalgonense]PON03568.1 hypothetical protein ATY29_30950 [Rhizobium hidalgonense]
MTAEIEKIGGVFAPAFEGRHISVAKISDNGWLPVSSQPRGLVSHPETLKVPFATGLFAFLADEPE